MSTELPDGWSQTTLGKVTTVKARIGWRGLAAREYTEEGPFLIAGKHIRSGVIDWDACDHISKIRYDESPEIQMQKGDVIFSKDGSIGNPALIEKLPGPATINGTMMMVRSDTELLEPSYLYQVVGGAAFHRMIREKVSGSSIPHIFQRDIVHFPVVLPPLDEQRRIAEVLRSVDETLHAARQVAEQCEQVLRLELDSIVAKLITDGVAQVKLGEVAKVKGGKRLPKGSEYSDEPTANPYIRVTDWRDYEIRTDDIRFISDEIAKSIWRYTISKSDVFISIAGSVGLVAAVPDELDGAYLTENAAKICISDPNELNATFLLAVLRSRALTEQVGRQKGVGGGVPKLALFRIEDLDIPLPDVALQAEIARSYESMRASVEAPWKAADQLDRTKAEMMSDLLSGRVRVPA